MYKYIKKILFLLDPEIAHDLVEKLLRLSGNYLPFILSFIEKNYHFEDEMLSQELCGIRFSNPVGLGAGFDKNASMLKGLFALGFGHIEYGTLTPKPQSGNEKPRLFRHIEQNSLQNAMGFNNKGLDVVLKNLEKANIQKPLGASIGKNKITPNEEAINDYEILLKSLKNHCDYFAINISSPNTKGLRDLQNEEFLKNILYVGKKLTNKPIFVKLSPDMDIQDALNLCQIVYENSGDGIIATNTTTDYSLLEDAKDFGGLSGEVLKEKSREFFKEISKEFYGKLTLISVGGISTGEEAYKRIKYGASLVQVYSSLVFNGASIVKQINEDLVFLLKKDRFSHISQAIGSHWER